MNGNRDKNIKIGVGYVETAVGFDGVTVKIHDEYKSNRKKDPVIVLEDLNALDLYYLIKELGKAFREHEDKTKEYRIRARQPLED